MSDRSNKGELIPRTAVAILASQMDSMCEALVISAQLQLPVSTVAIERLEHVLSEMPGIGEGPSFDVLPNLPEEPTVADMIAVAFWCRGTFRAFLSPDELAAQRTREPFGLGAVRHNRAAQAAAH